VLRQMNFHDHLHLNEIDLLILPAHKLIE
jgi:hypothetical protein